MKDIFNLWGPVFGDFMEDCSELVPRVVEWGPYTENKIVVKLDDNSMYIYDSLEHRIIPYFERRGSIEETTEQDWRNSFAKKLHYQMRRKNITSDMLSSITGISRITLSKYLNGKSTPSTYNTEKIASALGCYSRDLCVYKRER